MIAGEICEDLSDLSGPDIYKVHRLRDLAPLYAATKVVIVPVFEGAGSAIKTLEALGRGKPIVATSFALRGIQFDPAEFPAFDEADGFGARIKQLLDDRALRASAAKQSLNLSRKNGNDDLYDVRLNSAIREAIGSRARPDPGRAESPAGETSAIEWTPAFGTFNSLVRDWLSDGCLTETALRAFRAAPLERSACEQIFRALSKSGSPGRNIPANVDVGTQDGRRHSSGFDAFWADINQEGQNDDLLSSAEGNKLQFHIAPGVEAFIDVETDGESRRRVWPSLEPGALATGIAGAHAIPRPEGTAVLVQRYRQTYKSPRHGDPMSHYRGFHGGEYARSPQRVVRWTGPEVDASVILSIRSMFDAILSVEIVGVLADRIFETAVISVNGFRLPTLKSGHGSKLIALVPAPFLNRSSGIRLGLHVVETLVPGNGDPRKLGLRIADVVTETSLSPNHTRFTASPLVEAVSEMTSRSPEDFVFLCYRELFLRDPDPDGFNHHVGHINEGRPRILVLETFLMSAEFAQRFGVANYGRNIYHHLVSLNRFPR